MVLDWHSLWLSPPAALSAHVSVPHGQRLAAQKPLCSGSKFRRNEPDVTFRTGSQERSQQLSLDLFFYNPASYSPAAVYCRASDQIAEGGGSVVHISGSEMSIPDKLPAN